MRVFTRPSRRSARALRFGVASLALALLNPFSSCLSLAQEAPPPDYLKPRQTKQVAEIRDAIQKAANTVAASDEPWAISLWADIGEARERAGDTQGAFDVLKRFSGNSKNLRDVMSAMAPYIIDRGVTQQALQLLATSPNEDAEFIGFRAIIYSQAHTGVVAGALETLAQMSRATTRGIQPEQTGANSEAAADRQREIELAMRTVAIALAESGNFGRAMDIALGINNNSLRVGALLTIGAAQSRAGDRQSAGNTFKQADETIRGIQDKLAQALAIVQLAKAQAQGKDTEAAFNTAERLHQTDSQFGSFYASALKEISLEQARLGDSVGASRTAERIETLGGELAALEDIASFQLKTGDRSGALITCQEQLRLIPEKSESAEIVSRIPKIALVQANAGDPSAAGKSLNRALAMAPAVKVPEGPSSIFADVAVAQAQLGDIDAAVRTNSHVPPDNWRERKRIVKSIAKSQAESDHPFEALATMWSVECPQGNRRRLCLGEYDTALTEVMRVFAKNGNEKLAFTWVERSSLPAARAKGFLEIANGLLDRISPPLSISYKSTLGWDSY